VTSREFHELLGDRARAAGITVPPDLSAKLEAYYRLLATWNRKINLTSFNLSAPSADAFDRLLIEPVAAASRAPHDSKTMIDIGSGGGSPAVPFALAVGGVQVRMVESRTRKSVFLREALRSTELQGEVMTARFEATLSRAEVRGTHDLLTVRAVRLEPAVLAMLQAFVRPGGLLFLFHGLSSEPTGNAVPSGLVWTGTHALVASDRSLLSILIKS